MLEDKVQNCMRINKFSSFNITIKEGFYTVNTVLHIFLDSSGKATLHNIAHTTGLPALTLPTTAINTTSFQGITVQKHNSIPLK
jgi:hypothetical protein